MRILDRRDQLAILDDERHALELERVGGLEQADRRALGALDHRAGRYRDAELEPEVDGQRLEIDEAVLEQHRAEPAAVLGLGCQRLLELGLGQPTVAQQHLAEPHPSATVARRFRAPKFASRRHL